MITRDREAMSMNAFDYDECFVVACLTVFVNC
jgi:hypothetical protein